AVAEPGRQAPRVVGSIPFAWNALSKVLDRLGPRDRVSCCYEAGPTGYGLARALLVAGWACDVIAPSLVPKRSGQRLKADRRDAMKLAQCHPSGDLVAVFIPDEPTEAIPGPAPAREGAKKAEMVARPQLSKFLLRHGRRYPGKTTWNDDHRAWIAQVAFAEPAQQYVLTDGLATVESATLRCRQLTERLRELAESWRLAPLVKSFQAVRGVGVVTAVAFAAGGGDYRRVARAGDFMGCAGLSP